jgi:hypothetical protein
MFEYFYELWFPFYILLSCRQKELLKALITFSRFNIQQKIIMRNAGGKKYLLLRIIQVNWYTSTNIEENFYVYS